MSTLLGIEGFFFEAVVTAAASAVDGALVRSWMPVGCCCTALVFTLEGLPSPVTFKSVVGIAVQEGVPLRYSPFSQVLGPAEVQKPQSS